MQIRYSIKLTIKEYLEQRAWEQVELDHCPFHPEGGCGLAKHGAYCHHRCKEDPPTTGIVTHLAVIYSLPRGNQKTQGLSSQPKAKDRE